MLELQWSQIWTSNKENYAKIHQSAPCNVCVVAWLWLWIINSRYTKSGSFLPKSDQAQSFFLNILWIGGIDINNLIWNFQIILLCPKLNWFFSENNFWHFLNYKDGPNVCQLGISPFQKSSTFRQKYT